MPPAPPVLDRARRTVLLGALGAAALRARGAHAGAAPPQPPVEGVALDVQDGDSFVFRGDDGVRRRIRVSGIDAPEKHQPFADASRRALGAMLRDARLRIEPVKLDAYGRTVARVVVPGDADGERDLGLAMIEAGLAWHFVRYRADQAPADRTRYAQAERDARAARAGLWRDDAPEAPWDFRTRTRRREAAPAAARRPAPAP